jgi:hypothetical protein
MNNIDNKYPKEYRAKLGFTNQNLAKAFFSAKDIIPTVDFKYISLLNARLCEIVEKINELVVEELKVSEVSDFCAENIEDVFEKLKKHEIIPRMNNLGRRTEEVYFSWMRGYVIANYFTKAISMIFDVSEDKIKLVGDDDMDNLDNFKKTPKADLEVAMNNGQNMRIEVQSGFQGINDIKQHKVLEAKRIKREEGVSSMVVHFDLFNGQVAFVRLDDIEEDDVNWITRQQMEGQTVFNMDQNYFAWKLTELPPKFDDLFIN